VQGAFDGNAPKAQGDLVRAGRGNDSNLNFKRHRGNIMNAWTPFFDMVCEVPLCIDGDLDYGDAAQDAELMRGFAEYFHSMVFNWRGFDDMSQLCDLQMLLHGPGVLAYEDSLDWRPKAILAGNIYFPDGTELSLDNCEMAMVFTPMSAGQLWRKIENEKAAKAAGWNIEAVKNVIMDSATTGSEESALNFRNSKTCSFDGNNQVTQHDNFKTACKRMTVHCRNKWLGAITQCREAHSNLCKIFTGSKSLQVHTRTEDLFASASDDNGSHFWVCCCIRQRIGKALAECTIK
jgi:hypothetical protein